MISILSVTQRSGPLAPIEPNKQRPEYVGDKAAHRGTTERIVATIAPGTTPAMMAQHSKARSQKCMGAYYAARLLRQIRLPGIESRDLRAAGPFWVLDEHKLLPGGLETF